MSMEILNAYYFQHHTFCLVPRHVREDMEWMADVGTNAITLAVLEQDLFANKANMDIICREADRAGISVHAVPSRWGGLLAGAPKVPSLFTATHPETWILKEDGTPYYYDSLRPDEQRASSRHLRVLLSEPGEIAQRNGRSKASSLTSRKSSISRTTRPGRRRRFRPAPVRRRTSTRAPIFTIGSAPMPASSGRVLSSPCSCRLSRRVTSWSAAPGSPPLIISAATEGPGGLRTAWTCAGTRKALIGQAERFLAAARANGKGGLILVENISMSPEYNKVMDEHLPTVLSYAAEHLLYYYYGMNLDDPDGTMEVVAKHLKKLKR